MGEGACYEDYEVNSALLSPFPSLNRGARVDAPFRARVTPLINFNKPTTVSRLISVSRVGGEGGSYGGVLLPKFRLRSRRLKYAGGRRRRLRAARGRMFLLN